MVSKSKAKGNGFEHEIVREAIAYGLNAVRARGSDGRSIGEHEEVDCKVGPYKIQAKRRRKLTNYMIPSEHVDAVVCREDRGETLIVFPYDQFLALLAIAVHVEQESRGYKEASDV